MKRYSLLLLLVLGSLAGFSQGAIVMKIDNVTAAGGDKVISFEGNTTLAVAVGGGGAGGAGKPILDPIKIKKPLSVSTQLVSFVLTGRHIPTVEFDFLDSGGKMIYKIVLSDAMVNKFSYVAPESLTNEVWFSFQKIQYVDVVNNKTINYSVATGVVN
ncbi:MAG: type VI secretion system tube protein Hcp [Bacteroidetes bacterium]|nr:type VI secretion system tube protein Hcp [Bacteroidota bacterium]